jgi:hypothetical protein
MKKLMLAEICYRYNGAPKEIKEYHQVLINSSAHAPADEDYRSARSAVTKWFPKTRRALEGAELLSTHILETILSDNPEPAALYTEADLVSFGNFMALKVLKASGSAIVESDIGSYVWDSDLANWRHERETSKDSVKNESTWNPRTEYPNNDRLVECRYVCARNSPGANFFARVRWFENGLSWFNEFGTPIMDVVQFEWREKNTQ